MLYTDRSSITSKRKYTDEGFLFVPARISRSGVQTYTALEMGLENRDPNETIAVYRPEEEVFNKDSLSSFANKPVTNNHPPELVDAKNSRQYSVGMSGPVIERDENYVKADLTIIDAETIASIEEGKVELSNGYTADIEWTSGITPEGINFDAVQRNIKGNHIAIVSKGRAGSFCRVADESQNQNKNNMSKINIDGVDFEVSDQAAQAIGKLQKRVKDAEEETESTKKALEAKEDEMEEAEKEAKKTEDSLQAKLDSIKSKVPSTETLDSMVSSRAAFVDKAKSICPDVEWQGKDENTIRKEVVTKLCPDLNMDKATDAYIEARFDILVEDGKGNNDLDKAISDSFTKEKSNNKTAKTKVETAREKMIADSQNAWKGNTK